MSRPRPRPNPRRAGRSLRRSGRQIGSFANGVSRFSRLFSDQRERGARAADHGAELGVGEHVRPWQRRFAIALEHDDVFAAVGREAAEPVLHHEGRHRRRIAAPAPEAGARAARPSALRSSHGAGRSSCGASAPSSPRTTTRATAVSRWRSASRIPSERSRNTPPGLSFHPAQRGSCEQRHELSLHLVEVVGRVLVEDHDVGAQVLHAPVFLRKQDLAHERHGVGLGHAHQHDRQVAGDPDSPTGSTGRSVLSRQSRRAGARWRRIRRRATRYASTSIA